MKVKCDDCGGKFPKDFVIPLSEIHHLWERIDVGGIVPAGECPKCGALCYEDRIEVVHYEVRKFPKGVGAKKPYRVVESDPPFETASGARESMVDLKESYPEDKDLYRVVRVRSTVIEEGEV